MGHVLSADCNIFQPRKGWQSKRLASSKECQGITFIPRFGILLLPVYFQLCSCEAKHLHQLVGPTNIKKTKGKKVKKEVTTLEDKKLDLTKHLICLGIWTPDRLLMTLKTALTTAPVLGYPWLSTGQFILETRCLTKRIRCCFVPSWWHW